MKRFFLVIFSLLCFYSAAAGDKSIAVENLTLKQNGNVFVVNADLNIQWNEHLKKTLEHGISLFFVADAALYRPRWWWRDKKIAAVQRKWQLSYHPITREYRLNLGGLFQSFRSFEEVERAIARIRNWELIDAQKLDHSKEYTLMFRFALDYEALPKTFQIGIWGNREWVLDSGWIFQKNLQFTVEKTL